MAKLNVIAIGHDGNAVPGNALALNVIVGVTDNKGVGIVKLKITDFLIGCEIVGPGGSTSYISTATIGKLSGTYLLTLLPIAGQNWYAGVYIFSINVTYGTDHGQTIWSSLMA